MSNIEPIKKIYDLKKFEDFLSEKSFRDLLMFTLGTNCGLRISDIVALNVGDVKEKNHIKIVEKKTGKYKKFPINSKLKPMIAKYTKNMDFEDPLFSTIYIICSFKLQKR